jgi:hypothetical protein
MSWFGTFITSIVLFFSSLFGASTSTHEVILSATTSQGTPSVVKVKREIRNSVPINNDSLNATSSLMVIKEPDGTSTDFAKKDNQIYLDNGSGYKRIIPSELEADFALGEIDAPSFIAMGAGYFKDKNHIYISSALFFNELTDADFGTFNVLRDASGKFSNYGKDKNHIYYGGRVVSGADLTTFVAINAFAAKDKNHQYEADKLAK